MSKVIGQISTAENLAQLAKKFKSGDAVMSSGLRREFKKLSLNDNTRVVVYLMEVIGSRDQQFQTLQKENADLRELLKLNNIALDGEENDAGTGNKTTETLAGPIVSGSGMADESGRINLQTGEANTPVVEA